MNSIEYSFNSRIFSISQFRSYSYTFFINRNEFEITTNKIIFRNNIFIFLNCI